MEWRERLISNSTSEPFLIALALAAAPFAAQAETWNIYGWQNHSWEFVDDNGRDTDRMNSNAGNIGFAASVDTGMNGIHVNVQCEQFTFFNQFAEHWRAGGNAEFAGSSTWCNRNSKIGLSHPGMGEIMLATWLLPYNEGVAQWVDPFYDAGADSHTNIMGSVGASSSTFYNPVFGRSSGFNRRQENIMQYWSPNWSGFVFRFAWTMGNRDESAAPVGGGEIDPVIRSSSLAYTNGPFWGAVTWQDHEDWSAAAHGNMESSDAESIRVAGRYIMDLGDGMSVQISAMWEDMEYEFNGVTNVDAAMAAFGYSNFGSSYSLLHSAGEVIGATAAVPGTPAMQIEPTEDQIKAQKTLELVRDLFYTADTTSGAAPYTLTSGVQGDETAWEAVTALLEANDFAPANNRLTAVDESTASGTCAAADPPTCTDLGINVSTSAVLMAAVTSLNEDRDVDDDTDGIQAPDLTMTAADGTAGGSVEERNAEVQYQLLVSMATEAAKEAAGMSEAVPGRPAASAAANRATATAGQNVKIERDAWMISGKIKFGGPIDFRFSYMDADDLEVSCSACSGDWDETAADAWNVGMFYTMPGGTELRLTYSEVDNDDNGTYGQGISGTGLGTPGAEIEMFAVGIVHWFD